MPNHVHLLIKDYDGSLAESIKSLTIPYAQYYNNKYNRIGHFFQDRFRSEPVNDWEYFVTLLRYIHQNPVAANIVSDVNNYTWSSWIEYVNPKGCSMPVCATQYVLAKVPIDELKNLVYELLPKAQKILDYNYDATSRIDDELVLDFIVSICGEDYVNAIRNYPREMRNSVILQMREFVASIRQIARITGLSEKSVRLAR